MRRLRRAALAEGSVKAWQGQSDNGRFNENVREAVDGVRNDPAARAGEMLNLVASYAARSRERDRAPVDA